MKYYSYVGKEIILMQRRSCIHGGVLQRDGGRRGIIVYLRRRYLL